MNVAVMECYELFGITKNNASLLKPDGSFKDMPDFTHLYPFLLKYPALKNVAIVVKDLIDSGLGGQTNVNLNSSFIVLDTSSAREEDVSPITFLGTYFIRDELSRSRTRKKADDPKGRPPRKPLKREGVYCFLTITSSIQARSPGVLYLSYSAVALYSLV